MKKIVYILIIIFFVFLSNCKSYDYKIPEKEEKNKEIRVKLKLEDELKISINKKSVIMNNITNKKIKLKWNQKEIKIKHKDKKNYFNDNEFDYDILIYSTSVEPIKINDRSYFGKIYLIPKQEEIEIINILPVEKYLISVVPSEMPLSFPLEALKAQAVIARTYSYYFIEKYRDKRNFDVDNTVMYQVYNGFNFKFDSNLIQKLESAVNETKNQIVFFQDKPILAYFHSNSGGKIRSGLEYFGKNSDLPYLVSKEDPYSIGEKNDKWSYEMQLNTFKNKLGIINDLTNDMFIYNNNGFVDRFIYGKDIWSSKEIRKKIGYFELKSERFKIEVNNTNLYFSGIGFGHGVGLSQY
ncbi:MAG TPA: SpoIID/LytB domain-containing protein, partial [Spirochaetota bacterium]|nr:SpoIID/LytB domain-containing protein [Spirochaetota bacterium]